MDRLMPGQSSIPGDWPAFSSRLCLLFPTTNAIFLTSYKIRLSRGQHLWSISSFRGLSYRLSQAAALGAEAPGRLDHRGPPLEDLRELKDQTLRRLWSAQHALFHGL